MFARYSTAVTSGTLITLALLFVMQLLISLQPGAATGERERMILDLTKVRSEIPPKKHEPEIIKENLTKTLTPPDRLPQTGDNDPILVPRGKQHLPPSDPGIQFDAPVDGALVNMFRVEPVYPSRALTMGLEGHVIVQFDVNAYGNVIDPVVIESSHRMFEKPAIRAALEFRYKPRVVDGIALPTRGIRNLFTFTMNE